MDLSIIQLIIIFLGATGIGGIIAWDIRQRRINALEKMLHNYEKKCNKLELDNDNLEAFAKHIQGEREQNKSKGSQRLVSRAN